MSLDFWGQLSGTHIFWRRTPGGRLTTVRGAVLSICSVVDGCDPRVFRGPRSVADRPQGVR